jgi:nucleoside-diphosphate-sugar epimerase
MTKRLLITGGSGFIGSHCLEPALNAGFEVWATTSTHRNQKINPIISNVNWKAVNLLQAGAIEHLLNEIKPTHLLHTAWETTHGSYWTSPANLDWLAFGSRLFKIFAQNGGKRLVCAGTCAEYDWNYGYMVEGLTPELPVSFYGQMKQIHHKTLMAAAEQFGFSAVTGRIFFLYGPHENPNRIVPYACRQLQKCENAEFGNGNLYRDFLYVEDVAQAFVSLLQSNIEGACNVCSGTPTTLLEVLNTIGKISGCSELINYDIRSDFSNQPPMIVGNNEKLLTSDWKQTYSLEEGLTMTFDWFRDYQLL